MKISSNINVLIYSNNHMEDDDFIIQVENKCNDIEYIKKIKECYQKYGLDFVNEIDIAYSLYIYDKKNDILVVFSDIAGLNKIYYSANCDSLILGDNLIDLMNEGNIEKKINKKSLSMYFRYHYINAPETIFSNVYKIKPGDYLVYNKGNLEVKSYWNAIEKFNQNKKELVKSYEQCKQQLEKMIDNYIKKVIDSNENIGVYLSGGIDSSLVAALTAKNSKKKINTFSIGFYEEKFNEAEKAKKIATKIGTNHHELYVDEDTVKRIMKKIPMYYTEPFADPSELPTIILNEYAKSYNICKVITGDGADQLLCGSNIYDTVHKVQKLHRMCNPLNIYVSPKFLRYNRKLMYVFSNSDKKNQDQCDQIYNDLLLDGLFEDNGDKRLKNGYNIESSIWQEKRLILDLDTYCFERVITKMGVAAKRNGIEIYSPFLNRELIEYTFKIPHKYKYYKKIKKYILKEILYKYVPKELLDNKKKGFGIPMQEWMNTIFKEDIERLSTKEFIEKQNIFNYSKVNDLIKKLDDKIYKDILWDYYIFQLWYEKYMLQ